MEKQYKRKIEMRKHRIHNTLLRALPNVSKEFELKRLALERIDKIEDRIIQTNIMFILGLTFLNAVYGILFKNNFLTLFSKTHSLFNFKFTDSVSILTNSNNSLISFTPFLIDAIIFYIWYNKIIRYNHIKRHLNKVLKNNTFKTEDLLEEGEKDLDAQYLENVLLILSFADIAIMPLLYFHPEPPVISAIYISIIILIFYAYYLWLNLSKTNGQRKFSAFCLSIFSIATPILIAIWFYYKKIISFLSSIKLSQTAITKIVDTALVTSIMAEIAIFVCTLIVPLIWNDVIRNKNKTSQNIVRQSTKPSSKKNNSVINPIRSGVAIASLIILILIILSKSQIGNINTFWKVIIVILLGLVINGLCK